MQRSDEVLLSGLLKRCARLIDREIDQALKQHNIARSQYRVMYHVSRFGQPSQTDLREAMLIKASTLTLIIDSLVRKGWLIRTRDVGDRRINKLKLTAAGQRSFKQIPDPTRSPNQKILKSLGKQEAAALKISLNKIIKDLN
jgi:DNA-binding MarR family transcriptional regulator